MNTLNIKSFIVLLLSFLFFSKVFAENSKINLDEMRKKDSQKNFSIEKDLENEESSSKLIRFLPYGIAAALHAPTIIKVFGISDGAKWFGETLTYNYATEHILINTGATFITALPLFFFYKKETVLQSSLIFSGIQSAFWAFMNVQGISIIWSAYAGMLIEGMISNMPKSNFKKGVSIVSLIAAAGAFSYYAITFPAITSVAHASSMILGFGYGKFFGKKLKRRKISSTK